MLGNRQINECTESYSNYLYIVMAGNWVGGLKMIH